MWYMYVCMYVMYVCMYVCGCACLPVCVCVCIYMYLCNVMQFNVYIVGLCGLPNHRCPPSCRAWMPEGLWGPYLSCVLLCLWTYPPCKHKRGCEARVHGRTRQGVGELVCSRAVRCMQHFGQPISEFVQPRKCGRWCGSLTCVRVYGGNWLIVLPRPALCQQHVSHICVQRDVM